jgi:hypothetical protein
LRVRIACDQVRKWLNYVVNSAKLFMTMLGMSGPIFKAAQWAQIEKILQQCVLSHKISAHQKDAVINEYNDYLAIHTGPSPRPPG